MTVLGMPLEMFLVFVATILAGSIGAIHYVVVHIILGRPIEEPSRTQSPAGESVEK